VVGSTLSLEDRRALEALNFRLRTILPEEYQDTYQSLEPKPMKSAGLKFDAVGQVAWDEIWGSFCDLAMAGGPPHKGALLEPGTRAAVGAEPATQAQVAAEICRGIALATDLEAAPSEAAGWVRVTCLNDAMAGWLLRAITMENVAVRVSGGRLELPAAPHFRLEKEIKNVVTVAAKTCHYFLGHLPMTQRRRIAYLFATLDDSSPLIPFPDLGICLSHVEDIASGILLGLDKGKVGEAYVISGPKTTVREAIGVVADATGKKAPKRALPTGLLKALTPVGPMVGKMMGQPPNLRELISSADGVTFWATYEKAHRELGYEPRGLEQGFHDMLAAEGRLPDSAAA